MSTEQTAVQTNMMKLLKIIIDNPNSPRSHLSAWFWFIQPNKELDGQRPIEIFMENPEKVVAVAKLTN